jgi:hypothetical protein
MSSDIDGISTPTIPMTSLKVAATNVNKWHLSTMTLVNFSGVNPRSFVYNDACRSIPMTPWNTKDFDQWRLTPRHNKVSTT